MTIWIALLRGINVGGTRVLSMKDLGALLEREGFNGVRTYIQSGNVVFRSSKGTSNALAKRIGCLILESHGFEPAVLVLSVRELMSAVAANPFPKADGDPKSLHLFFLPESPRAPDLDSLDRLKTGEEAFALKGKVFYLYTPDGFGVSKLAVQVERFIGVGATARNWRTVNKLLEMARDSVSLSRTT
jgi:uncharacterized protein (DUF1697 family)